MNVQLIEVSKICSEEHSQRIAITEEELSALAASIRDEGLINAITVKRTDEGFTVIAGHRRLEACKRNGWYEIPANIIKGDEAHYRSITFAENFFSENLTAIELAVAIADEYKTGRMTIERIALGFHKSTDWVRRQIDICGWPPDVIEGVHVGGLSIASASNLARIPEDTYRQSLVRQAVENGATARTTSAWLQAYNSMLPLAEAIEQDPVDGDSPRIPMVPQAPCLACHDVFRTDELSHVPICAHCIRMISTAGQG